MPLPEAVIWTVPSLMSTASLPTRPSSAEVIFKTPPVIFNLSSLVMPSFALALTFSVPVPLTERSHLAKIAAVSSSLPSVPVMVSVTLLSVFSGRLIMTLSAFFA